MKKRTIIQIGIIGIIGISFLSSVLPVSAAVTGTITWEGTQWEFSRHSSSAITESDAHGRSDVLKITKKANYHAQLRSQPVFEVGSSYSISVDFYGETVGSWSWAPGLKVDWEDSEKSAYILKSASSYARWWYTDGSFKQVRGTMYQDRWYTLKITVTYFSSGSGISLDIRDITNNGDWVNLASDNYDGVYLDSDPKIYLGTSRTSDYSYPGSNEIYYFDQLITSAGIVMEDFESYSHGSTGPNWDYRTDGFCYIYGYMSHSGSNSLFINGNGNIENEGIRLEHMSFGDGFIETWVLPWKSSYHTPTLYLHTSANDGTGDLSIKDGYAFQITRNMGRLFRVDDYTFSTPLAEATLSDYIDYQWWYMKFEVEGTVLKAWAMKESSSIGTPLITYNTDDGNPQYLSGSPALSSRANLGHGVSTFFDDVVSSGDNYPLTTEGFNYPVGVTGGTANHLVRSQDGRESLIGNYAGDSITGSDFGFPQVSKTLRKIAIEIAVTSPHDEHNRPGEPPFIHPSITIDVYHSGSWDIGSSEILGDIQYTKTRLFYLYSQMNLNDLQVRVRIASNPDHIPVKLDYLRCQIVYEGPQAPPNPSDSHIEGYLYPDVCFTTVLLIPEKIHMFFTDESGYFNTAIDISSEESNLEIMCPALDLKTWTISLSKGEYKVLSLSGDWARTLSPNVVANAQEIIAGLGSGATSYDKAEAIYLDLSEKYEASAVIDYDGNFHYPPSTGRFYQDTTLLDDYFLDDIKLGATNPDGFVYRDIYMGICWHASVLASSYCLALGIPSRIIYYMDSATATDDVSHYTTEVFVEKNGIEQWIPLDTAVNGYVWFDTGQDTINDIIDGFGAGSVEDLYILYNINGLNPLVNVDKVKLSEADQVQYAWYDAFLTFDHEV